MTIDDFIGQLETYYGAYPEKMTRVRVMVKAYLKDFKPAKLPELLKLVCMSHSFNYGSPDIAAIEKAYDSALKNKKCEDMKVLKPTGYIIADEPTLEEIENGRKLVESGQLQSLSDSFSNAISKKRLTK